MTSLRTDHQLRSSFDLRRFWQEEITTAQSSKTNFKTHSLPLARIKKVMKSDPEVKMISAETPILFAKACEVFIAELTQRAWVHAKESKRRTLLRSDVTMGISKTDMCDFLIDIVPRMEAVVAETTTFKPGSSKEPSSYTFQPETTPAARYEPSSSVERPAAPAYYSDLSRVTPEQLQQYQLQLQRFIEKSAGQINNQKQ